MKIFFYIAVLFFLQGLQAQITLPIPLNIKSALYKGTRSADGKPGKNYWQNFAVYDIDVSFDPETRLLKGNVAINYTNKSPDTLKQVEFKLYPNLYKKGSPRLTKIDPDDLGDGVIIEKLMVNDDSIPTKNYQIDGTNMNVRIKPLLAGQSMKFNISYSYTLNKGSHNRTGEVEIGAYFIAYFFPRITVYDDIDGWNENPYLGTQEFYNDFCNFRLTVHVPAAYTVWATG
ncbi:MAG: peptidase, partial [Ferruginibacter sp.]